jgi:hypothetical protein
VRHRTEPLTGKATRVNSLEDREFNDRLQASAQGFSAPLVNLLKIAFGEPSGRALLLTWPSG